MLLTHRQNEYGANAIHNKADEVDTESHKLHHADEQAQRRSLLQSTLSFENTYTRKLPFCATLSEFFCKVQSRVLTVLTDEDGGTESVVWGLGSIGVSGIIMGLLFPGDDTWMKSDATITAMATSYAWSQKVVQYVSAMLGYIYFLAWSISFYPQVFSNYRRRSTEGLSVDFCYLNLFGYLCYSSFNCSLFWLKPIHRLYADRHDGQVNLVKPNDVAFAVHAVALSSCWLGQIWYYSNSSHMPPDGTSANHKFPSKFTMFALLVMTCTALGYMVLILLSQGKFCASDGQSSVSDKNDIRHTMCAYDRFNWLDFLYLLADFKVSITILKYIPQVILNFRRKSTAGWNVWNVLLDVTGGLLSICQLLLDCWWTQHWDGITGDPAKFALGFVTIFFDAIFFVQHYVLYPKKTKLRKIESPTALTGYEQVC